MKKGFTLVELLGVIVILGIIATITVPLVQRSIVESTETAYNDQIISFERAAKNYVGANVYIASDCDKQKCSVTLEELQKEGYLPSGNIKNPKNDQNFNLENEVSISFANGKFSYKYDTTQDEN